MIPELSKSQKARHAIRTFKILADSLPLQGVYHPSGNTGSKLADALIQLSPEIYGSMANPRISELKGLEYVIDRMPRGIENCSRIIFTGQEDFQDTSFKQIIPLRRRRISYAVSDHEICFVLTTGTSEIYDILTHLTFLNIEARKIWQQARNRTGGVSTEWLRLEKVIKDGKKLRGEELQQAVWNLSIILGRTYKETLETYEYFERSRREQHSNNGLFNIIYGIGSRVMEEREGMREQLSVYFTPSLHDMINHQKYANLWAHQLKKNILELDLLERPLHIVSANMHSMRNLIYGAGAVAEAGREVSADIYQMVFELRKETGLVEEYAKQHGYTLLKDRSGSAIDVHIIDLLKVDMELLHPALSIDPTSLLREKPVLIVIDYAFGTQAFDIMDELLQPMEIDGQTKLMEIGSISIMGKAGILPGKQGDIMLATSHVMEGIGNSYIFVNELQRQDFPKEVAVYSGPMLTVLGTSLQNRDVLERFHSSDWQVVGLEMEGGHYQRAINAAIIQGHIPPETRLRYAYYASDNPMVSGQTLASGPMGDEGVVPTYMITKCILEKICETDMEEMDESETAS